MVSDSPDQVSGAGLRLLLPVALLFSAYLLFGRLQEYWRLRHFKGPATTGISWWWHSRAVLSGKAQEYYGEVNDKYGMIKQYVRLTRLHTDQRKVLLRESRQII
jgi:hypothetical protein